MLMHGTADPVAPYSPTRCAVRSGAHAEVFPHARWRTAHSVRRTVAWHLDTRGPRLLGRLPQTRQRGTGASEHRWPRRREVTAATGLIVQPPVAAVVGDAAGSLGGLTLG